jgi:hypothetical protein
MDNIEEYVKHIIEKRRDLVFLCSTRSTAKILLRVLHKNGYRWINGDSLLETDEWDINKETSCYGVCKTLDMVTVDPIDYYSEQYLNKKIIDLKFYRAKEIAKCLVEKK